jgi:pimeloyl-ACP methyl ester carboxylesterase
MTQQPHSKPLMARARRSMSSRIAMGAIQAMGVVVVALASTTAQAQGPFYQASAEEIVGPPGTVIRQEPMSFAPAGAAAYRVLYRSRGMHDEPIAVSGVIIVPPGSPPPNGRKIVAWAHPTTGVVSRCAPSLAMFIFQQIQGSRPMVENGYVIAATDYLGLGTPGPHPYLVGDSEARAVIDSVRAARSMPEAGTGNDFAVWGHSQGGQAALYTGIIQKSYAPELNLVGVAAAAPATELGALMNADIDTAGGRNLTAMTLWSWSRVYGAPIGNVLDPVALPVVDRLADECIESIYDLVMRQRTERPLAQHFLSEQNLAGTEPWRTLLASNTPGVLPRDIPVFLAQGTADQLVRPDVTKDYMDRLCRSGTSVQMLSLPGVNHGWAASKATPAVIEWLHDRFAGAPVPSDCVAK